jgi:hypothetical protein
MKIIKQFEDHDYYEKCFPPPNDNGTWYWGLGEDANIYALCPTITNDWSRIDYVGRGEYPTSLKQLKRIVKEFGELLIWL